MKKIVILILLIMILTIGNVFASDNLLYDEMLMARDTIIQDVDDLEEWKEYFEDYSYYVEYEYGDDTILDSWKLIVTNDFVDNVSYAPLMIYLENVNNNCLLSNSNLTDGFIGVGAVTSIKSFEGANRNYSIHGMHDGLIIGTNHVGLYTSLMSINDWAPYIGALEITEVVTYENYLTQAEKDQFYYKYKNKYNNIWLTRAKREESGTNNIYIEELMVAYNDSLIWNYKEISNPLGKQFAYAMHTFEFETYSNFLQWFSSGEETMPGYPVTYVMDLNDNIQINDIRIEKNNISINTLIDNNQNEVLHVVGHTSFTEEPTLTTTSDYNIEVVDSIITSIDNGYDFDYTINIDCNTAYNDTLIVFVDGGLSTYLSFTDVLGNNNYIGPNVNTDYGTGIVGVLNYISDIITTFLKTFVDIFGTLVGTVSKLNVLISEMFNGMPPMILNLILLGLAFSVFNILRR